MRVGIVGATGQTGSMIVETLLSEAPRFVRLSLLICLSVWTNVLTPSRLGDHRVDQAFISAKADNSRSGEERCDDRPSRSS
jgi:aspartate-semialdehyde dehydrogenase